jgi:hypothetical protein
VLLRDDEEKQGVGSWEPNQWASRRLRAAPDCEGATVFRETRVLHWSYNAYVRFTRVGWTTDVAVFSGNFFGSLDGSGCGGIVCVIGRTLGGSNQVRLSQTKSNQIKPLFLFFSKMSSVEITIHLRSASAFIRFRRDPFSPRLRRGKQVNAASQVRPSPTGSNRVRPSQTRSNCSWNFNETVQSRRPDEHFLIKNPLLSDAKNEIARFQTKFKTG